MKYNERSDQLFLELEDGMGVHVKVVERAYL